MQRHGTHRTDRQAFTLIELLVVNRQAGLPSTLNRDIGSSAYFVTWQWDQVAPIPNF